MDVQDLDRIVRTYQDSAFAVNTKIAYATHRRAYTSFCQAIGSPPVPATTQLLCRYVAHLCKTLQYSSMKQYINIVRILHLEWGIANPLENNYILTQTMRGARRVMGDQTTRKDPITPQMLLKIYQHIDISAPLGASVWAATLMMFFGLLRRSNVVPTHVQSFDPALHLRRRDIRFDQRGVLITIRWSKTNQFRNSMRTLPLPRIANHVLCPAQAIFHALQLTAQAPGDGPAFVTTAGLGGATPLTSQTFWRVLRKALVAAGMDIHGLGTHSLRRGGSCFLFNIGIPESDIRELGGWASNAYVRYITANTDRLAQTTAAMAAALPRQ